jgi:hypothetical protein
MGGVGAADQVGVRCNEVVEHDLHVPATERDPLALNREDSNRRPLSADRGIHSLQAGTGPLSAIVVGFVAGGFTLSVGQCAPSWSHAQESIIDGLLTKSAGNAIRNGRSVPPLLIAYFGSIWGHNCFMRFPSPPTFEEYHRAYRPHVSLGPTYEQPSPNGPAWFQDRSSAGDGEPPISGAPWTADPFCTAAHSEAWSRNRVADNEEPTIALHRVSTRNNSPPEGDRQHRRNR